MAAIQAQLDTKWFRNLTDGRSLAPPFKLANGRRSSSLDAALDDLKTRRRSSLLSYDTEPSGSVSTWSGSEEKRPLMGAGGTGHVNGARAFPLLQSSRSRRRAAVRVVTAALFVFVLGLLGGISLRDDRFGVQSALEDYGISFRPSSCQDPYTSLGRLVVDQDVPTNNRWVPYDPKCDVPQFMAALRSVTKGKGDKPLVLPLPKRRRTRDPSKLPLPWLHGKTVLLYGDQVERQHVTDFCKLVGGKFASIGAGHKLSPSAFVNGIDEKVVRPASETESSEGSRPAVCYVEQWDFMLISAFHYGLANRVELERGSLLEDEHFHPPLALDDRIDHVVKPLLHSLERKPDLIEFSSGFWDLRHFAAIDHATGQPTNSDLTEQRLEWYSTRLRQALVDLSRSFPNTHFLWRALLQTPNYEATAFSRVAALDQLSRVVVSELNRSNKLYDARTSAPAPGRLGHVGNGRRPTRLRMSKQARRSLQVAPREKDFGLQQAYAGSHEDFLTQVRERIGEQAGAFDDRGSAHGSQTRTKLKGMIRINEWSHLM